MSEVLEPYFAFLAEVELYHDFGHSITRISLLPACILPGSCNSFLSIFQRSLQSVLSGPFAEYGLHKGILHSVSFNHYLDVDAVNEHRIQSMMKARKFFLVGFNRLRGEITLTFFAKPVCHIDGDLLPCPFCHSITSVRW